MIQNLYVDGSSFVEADTGTLRPLYGGFTQSEYLPQFSNIKYPLYNGTIAYDFGPATLTSLRPTSTTRLLQTCST